MGNLLCTFSVIFIDMDKKKIINKCKYPYCLAEKIANKKNLTFLYKKNGMYQLSSNKVFSILPVIFDITSENDLKLHDKFIIYNNIPIWIILFNEKLNIKKLKINYFINGENKLNEFDIEEIKFDCLKDILKK